jgi:hypothetical protein
MSDDIVERLRAWSPLIAAGLEAPAASLTMDEAAAEIERLRARVDALRWPLAVYIHAHASGSNVPPHIEAAARAALEAKP